MLTNLKSIVRRIDTNNAKIVYKKYSKTDTQKERFAIYFSVLAGEDKTTYEALTKKEQKIYISNSAEIDIPDTTIEEFYADYRGFDPITVEYTLNMIFSVVPSIKDAPDLHPEAFALFCILHELGHWDHFLSCGKMVHKYIGNPVQAKELFNEQRILQKECLQAKSLTDGLKKKALAWTKKYHDMPGEKIADEYALSQFPNTWRLLQDYL